MPLIFRIATALGILTSVSASSLHAENNGKEGVSEQLVATPTAAPRRRAPRVTLETAFSGGDGLTLAGARISARAMLPIAPPERMLMIRPSFEFTSLNATSFPDTPSSLYSTGLNLMWLERLDERLTLTMAANPSINGDRFEFGRNVRVFAMGAVAYEWIPDQLKVSAGAAWLGRSDIGVVPAAGVEWTPSDDWNISLIMPQPRVSHRFLHDEESELWGYAAGSIEGGTFDVRRASGLIDELSIREFRSSVGLEFRGIQTGNMFVEAGVGFGRRLEFESSGQSRSYSPGLGIRLGWTR